MKVLKALLGTISLFGVAIFFAWIATLGVWGVIALFATIFIAVFAVILGGLS